MQKTTEGDDHIYGSKDNDIINGKGGNDVISGEEGDDELMEKMVMITSLVVSGMTSCLVEREKIP